MGWMKPCIAITFAGWKPPMSILITGGIQRRAAGRFTAWNFRTPCSKRYTTSMQSGSFDNSTVQQNYTRGPNETAFLADIHLCCLIEIDSYSNRSNTAHHCMRAQGVHARSSISAVKNQGHRECWRHG